MKPTKNKSALRRAIKLLLIPVLVLLLLACAIRKNDYTPYPETTYYKQTIEQLEQQKPTITDGDTLKVGWAKVNITPPAPFPLAGYGKRLGKKYTEVHDSAYVRTFAFDNGEQQAYFVALDMLITPMTLTASLHKAAAAKGIQPQQIYLSATHTHTSFGGWSEKLMGWVMAGKYSQEQLEITTAQVLESIMLAENRKQPARIGYGKADAGHLVGNRLNGEEAARDSTIRFVYFEQEDGATAVLAAFSAHATVLPSKQPTLSSDYPGAFVHMLEQQVDFAAFTAGAVASHKPIYHHQDSFRSVDSLGTQLARTVLPHLQQLPLAYTRTLGYSQVPLQLPAPEFRISDNYHLAPWLFYGLFGNYPAFVSSLQLGDIVLLSAPADYSGEFMKVLEPLATLQNQQLLVTGFNGGYMGYLTPSRHYMLDEYEVRDMNFYGKWGGDYITAVLSKLLNQHKSEQ